MSGALPLGTFARQRRDFAHEQLAWGNGVGLVAAGHEWTAQLWNNGTLGWVLEVYGIRVYADPAMQVGISWSNDQLDPAQTGASMPVRGDQPKRFGVLQQVVDTPLTFTFQLDWFATPSGLLYLSDSPLFIVPANFGLTFDFFPNVNENMSVDILYSSAQAVSQGRTDLS